MADAAKQPETKLLLDDIARMTHTAEELCQQTPQLQRTLDSLPRNFVDALTHEPVVKEAELTANQAILSGRAATTQLAAVEASIRRLDGSVANLSQQFDRLNSAYDPTAVHQMAEEGKRVAAHEARSLVYLITACAAGLIVLHALLLCWRRRAQNGNQSPAHDRTPKQARHEKTERPGFEPGVRV
jgi:hypothetical protein